jgi:superfamily II helicase
LYFFRIVRRYNQPFNTNSFKHSIKHNNYYCCSKCTSNKTKKKIYLAESSYDTLDFRDSIKRELQDLDYTILPSKQLPLIAPVLHAEVTHFIQEADLCIHLMGAGYGVVPEGTQKYC